MKVVGISCLRLSQLHVIGARLNSILLLTISNAYRYHSHEINSFLKHAEYAELLDRMIIYTLFSSSLVSDPNVPKPTNKQ